MAVPSKDILLSNEWQNPNEEADLRAVSLRGIECLRHSDLIFAVQPTSDHDLALATTKTIHSRLSRPNQG
ncbi:hypothetical protein GGE07_005754 [Sinorhizobium terangae]|uniref:hypothetical protein n=1 Tax=Sinorhizobium terangae TaxID=110322 RepID=UPI0017D7369E|nr:hypothetical protein [Sinorhizobium terangae]